MCRVVRTTDGSLVLDLPDDLAAALDITSGDKVEVAKDWNGMFDMWKVEPPIETSEMIERMNRICREALDDPSA